MADSTEGGARVRVPARVWVALTIAAVALTFILQNRQVVSINFLLITLMAPLWIVLVAVFGAGLATGSLVSRRKG